MTKQKYLKIISDLFRLNGYATGILSGMTYQLHNDAMLSKVNDAVKFLDEQQNMILTQLDKGE